MRLTPCVCTASCHFDVERKCELVERLDMVHIRHGHRAEMANTCLLASLPSLNPSNALFFPLEN